jgi:hypothetical protein
MVQSDVLDADGIGKLISDHNKLRQQCRILDMDELFKDAEGRRGRTIRDSVTHGISAPVEMQTISAIQRLGMLFSRQTPEQH